MRIFAAKYYASREMKDIFRSVGAVCLCILCLIACRGNGLDEPEPQPEIGQGAEYQIIVVFAPGQLGDKGYADNVMLGISLLERSASNPVDSTSIAEKDSCDVQFISTFDIGDTRKVMKAWAEKPANPFYEGDYRRRLLVLTEYFMMEWLEDIKDILRPDDEVLLLKVNDEDVRQAAATYGLEGRLHGLNISAARAARNFYRYMTWTIDVINEYGYTYTNQVLPYYRLYDTDAVTYRDSVYEVLTEELEAGKEIQFNSILRKSDTNTYSVLLGSSVIQTAYQFAQQMYQDFIDYGYYFAITDLGSGIAGWNYYVFGLGQSNMMFNMLMFDTEEIATLNDCYIFRRWDKALYEWGQEWMSRQTGDMPEMKLYSNGDMCEDNIPNIDDFFL